MRWVVGSTGSDPHSHTPLTTQVDDVLIDVSIRSPDHSLALHCAVCTHEYVNEDNPWHKGSPETGAGALNAGVSRMALLLLWWCC